MNQTETGTPATDRLSKQRFYRRLMFGLLLGGVAGALLLREVLGYPLAGEAVYWVGVLGFLGVWFGSPTTLFDERDVALERKASQITLYVFAVVLPVGASAVRVLQYTDTYEVSAEVSAALWAYVAVFVVFGVVYVGLRFRQ